MDVLRSPSHSFDGAYLSAARADISSSRISVGRALSRPQSPSFLNLSNSSPPNIFDQIAQWFNSIISRRKVVGSGLGGLVSGSIFLFLSVILQWSPLHPLQSVKETFGSLLSYRVWGGSLLCCTAYFLLFSFITSSVVRWDQSRRPSVLRTETWLCTALSVFISLINSTVLFRLAQTSFDDCGWLLILLGICLSSSAAVLSSDYRLFFSSRTQGVRGCLWETLSVSPTSPLTLASHDALRTHQLVVCLALLLGSLSYGFSFTLLSLLSPSLHFFSLLLSISTFVVFRISTRLIRDTLMTPMLFPFPPPHAVLSPTPSQTRTLVNVLAASDPLLKLFGFFDLSRLAWADEKRRLEVFSLSLPGGHPRNWTAVCGACLEQLAALRLRMDCANRQTANLSALIHKEEEDDDEVIDRGALRLPQRIRQQVYNTAIRNRQTRVLRSREARLAPPPAPSGLAAAASAQWKKLRGLVEPSSSLLPFHDALLIKLSVQGLYRLVVSSYDEDRFGVVQKDLAGIVSSLLQSHIAIDIHFRLRQTRGGCGSEDELMMSTKQVIETALCQIRAKFGPHLQALHLSDQELSLLKAL